MLLNKLQRIDSKLKYANIFIIILFSLTLLSTKGSLFVALVLQAVLQPTNLQALDFKSTFLKLAAVPEEDLQIDGMVSIHSTMG